MQRRGQCKCGEVLTFEQGPEGFKGPCPRCGAIVRLRVSDAELPQAVPVDRARPPRPSDPRLAVAALRAPGPAVPGEIDPDETTPFEPLAKVAVEPRRTTTKPVTDSASFLQRYRLRLVIGAGCLFGIGAALALWRKLF
jgi:hypothetical protein